KSGLNSGMMILQYVAAGYASDNKVLAHPASADSIPTSANQEDFVPMGMSAASKAREAIENAAHVVAMEYLAAAQGLEFLQPLRPGVGPRAAYVRIRGSIPRLVDDRSLAEDVDRILGWMKDGALVAAAEAASGGLAWSLALWRERKQAGQRPTRVAQSSWKSRPQRQRVALKP